MMNRIRGALEGMGILVWTDEGLTPGTESWKTTIEIKIRNAAGIVVILSPSSNQSIWVERELEYASIHKIKIFPLLVEGEPADSIPIELINSQWIDLRNEANFSKQVYKLGLAIQAESAATSEIPKYQPATRNPLTQSTPTKSHARPIVLSAVIVGTCIIFVTALSLSYGPQIMEYIGSAKATLTPMIVEPPTSTFASPTGTTEIDISLQPSETPTNYTDPIQFVRDYFSLINERRYEEAWSELSTAFKEDLADRGGGGYEDYVLFWNSVSNVEIDLIEIRSQSSTQALVYTEILFHFKDGHTERAQSTYHLVKATAGTSWLFEPSN
jgi:hypothetical protein